jgi:hypothetical protein
MIYILNFCLNYIYYKAYYFKILNIRINKVKSIKQIIKKGIIT